MDVVIMLHLEAIVVSYFVTYIVTVQTELFTKERLSFFWFLDRHSIPQISSKKFNNLNDEIDSNLG